MDIDLFLRHSIQSAIIVHKMQFDQLSSRTLISTMKNKLLLLVGIVSTQFLIAQKAISFAVPFSSGAASFALVENDWTAAKPEESEIVNGRYYRYIHLTSLPNYVDRLNLDAAGIHVLHYIAGKTYVASIKVGTTFPLASEMAIAGISKISTLSKMHLELSFALSTGSFPFYTTNGDGNIGITFTYYSDIPHNTVLDLLYARNEDISYHNPNSHRVTAWMLESQIDSFLALPFVCAAELKDDVPQPDNNVGRTSHRDNWLAQDMPGGRMYNGAGISVMLQDDGIIGPHIDYTGRLQQQYITSNGGDHGDHCAGIIMGGGNKDPLTRGMGWGADLYVYQAAPYQGFDSIYNHYTSNNIVITSTSYSDGCNAGYTTLAQTLDQQIWDMPNLIHVFSAGNNGTVDCSYGAGAGWGNITGGHKHSKNSIAVGNLDHLDALNSSSSRGPVHDGRMKPEVCAVGTNVYSTSNPDTYVYKTGTSMSCPAVSGTFSELYQAYREIHGTTAESGLMKAIIMNTCDDLGNVGPDFQFGYGRINGRKAIQPIEQNWFIVDSIDNAQSDAHTITVPNGIGQLKVMIYWHDFPGAVNASVALVNNLDMNVTAPNATNYNPWVLDFTPNVSNLNAVAVRGNDIRNNHEQVTIDNPTPGSYTVTVNGTVVPMGPQTYFLVWYFEPADELVLTYPNGGEGFVPAETEVVRWDAWENTSTFDLEYTTDGTTWLPITTGVVAARRYYNWTVPVGLSGMCKVRVTRGTTVDSSDANFSIAEVPAGVNVAWACPDSLCLKWTAVAGATGYDVFKLGNVYMDSVGSSAVDSFVVTGLNNYVNTYWFSVRAKAPTQTIGRRAIAIEKTPGVYCPGALDASATSVVSPMSAYYGCMTSTGVPVVISVYNPGLVPLTNVPVSFSYDGGTPVTEMYVGTIASFSTVTYTFTATVNIGSVGAHSLDVWTSFPGDVSALNDTTTLAVNYNATPVVVPPMTETFETFALCPSTSDCGATNCTMINGFTNVGNGQGDDIDWRTFQGNTPSANTGPSTDFIPGTAAGNYLYLEASTCSNQTAELITPCIDLTTFPSPSLLFGYHMFGSSMGSLHIDVYANGMWNNDVYVRNGSQSSAWLQATVSLNAYIGQIILVRFRGITGGDSYSDIAIDGVRVEDPTGVNETQGSTFVSVFPNPGDGLFNLAVSGLNGTTVSSEVYDVSGRLVQSANYGTQSGVFQTQVDLSNLENGTYFIEVMVGEKKETIRTTKMD